MGYEVEISVVQNRDGNLFSDGWCQVMATLELSKIGDGKVSNIIKKYRKEQGTIHKKKKYFFYEDHTNREAKVYKDKYGSYLPIVPINEFYEALIQDNNTIKKNKEYGGAGYRRYEVAINLLKPFIKSKQWKYERSNNWLYVMAYGH